MCADNMQCSAGNEWLSNWTFSGDVSCTSDMSHERVAPTAYGLSGGNFTCAVRQLACNMCMQRALMLGDVVWWWLVLRSQEVSFAQTTNKYRHYLTKAHQSATVPRPGRFHATATTWLALATFQIHIRVRS